MWTAVAVAGTAGIAGEDFAPVRASDGCAIAMRPESHPEGVAMRAECDWPDVDADHLIALLARYEAYGDYVFPISESRVVREDAGPDGPRTLVYQRQSVFGLADREVLLWMTRTEVPGGARYAWSAAHDEPLALRPGAIRTPRNTGSWTIRAREGGGSRVIHEIALDAGGSVPRWIVELVRTRSFAKIMSDVRAVGAAP